MISLTEFGLYSLSLPSKNKSQTKGRLCIPADNLDRTVPSILSVSGSEFRTVKINDRQTGIRSMLWKDTESEK